MTMTLPGPTEVNLRPKISMEKMCSSCKETKPLTAFYKRKVSVDGLQGKCKMCTKVSAYEWRDANPHKAKAAEQKYRSTTEYRTYQREFKRKEVLAKYGITQADYDQKLADQAGGCAICGSVEADSLGRRMYLDHDHQTGKARGLLCGKCNFGIGSLQDDPNLLRAAADYLEVYR